jgi:hypothetical protein
MHDILRERIWRKLEVLPEAQLYEVLDYIEFLEARYAARKAREPDSLQRFAERLEDGMRIRSVAPKVITGTLGLFGTAQKVLRSVTDAGREILGESGSTSSPVVRPQRPPNKPAGPAGGEANGR